MKYWMILILMFRDFLLAVPSLILVLKKAKVLEVGFLGKAATFNLLYALPLFVLSSPHGPGRLALIFGWAFLGWGFGLYLLTGWGYMKDAIARIRAL